MDIYIGQFAEMPVGNRTALYSPGGDAITHIDLRSIPQKAAGVPGVGIFFYDGQRSYNELARHLTTELDGELPLAARSALSTLTGKTFSATRFDRVIEELFNTKSDPTGLTSWKPLRMSRRGGTGFKLNKIGWLFRDGFSLSHPSLQNTVEVFRADYARNRRAGVPLLNMQKFTASMMRRLYGRMGDDLLGILPTEYRGDGWRDPATPIGDDFTEASDTALADHTATGTGGGFDWTEIQDSVNVIASSDDAQTSPNNSRVTARADSAMSSDGHYAQADVTATSAVGSGFVETMVRKDNSATLTFYCGGLNFDNDLYAVSEYIADSLTFLDFDSHTNTPGTLYKVETIHTEADVLSVEIDDSEVYSATQNTITGNTYTGLHGITGANSTIKWDDFVADILAAGGGDPEGKLVAGKLVGGGLLVEGVLV